MLLIPVGVQDGEVRRNPWVSLSIMGLMAACFLFLGPPSRGGGWGDEVESRVRSVEDFALSRPYLRPSADVESLFADGVKEELRRRREQETRNPAGLPGFIVEGQVQELASLERALRASLREAPSWVYGFVPARPSPVDALTSMFLHGGWLHLIGNLLFLFAMGPFLEDVYGRIIYSALYVLSGVVAAYLHAAMTPESFAPLIGASGAIAGVMGAFLIRLGTSRIRFLFLPIVFLPFIRISFGMRAALVLPIWFAEQALFAAEAPTQSGVAFWAHIGGFLFGIVVAILVKVFRLEQRWVDPGIEKKISWTQNPALIRARDARLAGNRSAAGRELVALLQKEPDNVDALRLAFDLDLESGRGPEAARTAERLLALYLKDRETQLARALVFDVTGRARENLTPRLGLSAARFLENDGEYREALDLYEEVVSRFPGDSASLQALSRIAAMRRREGDLQGAEFAFVRARDHPRFSPEWEQAFKAAGAPPVRAR